MGDGNVLSDIAVAVCVPGENARPEFSCQIGMERISEKLFKNLRGFSPQA